MIFVDLIEKGVPYLLKVDDMSAMKKVIDGNVSPQYNHYAVRLNIALNRYQRNELTIEHVPSSLQLADIVTKPATTRIMSTICDLLLSHEVQFKGIC